MSEQSPFRARFTRCSRGIRARLAARRSLTGLAFGLLLATLVATGLWVLGLGEWRPWAALLGVAGAAAGLGFAAWKRWSDEDVALYLDAKLEGAEAISTALERDRAEPAADPELQAFIIERASALLERARQHKARPRVLVRRHLLLPLGLAALAAVSAAPVPPAPPAEQVQPGFDRVKIAELRGLEALVELEKLDARDAAQRQRLDGIAEDARRLREELAHGLEKREAQARIAKLRDAVAAERLATNDRQNRAGLEAAVGKLAADPRLRNAARALGDGDLVELDEEMQRLANQAEQADRDRAKHALEEAARAARERGAKELAQSLEEQRRLFEQREAEGQALRELGDALRDKLDEQGRRDLAELEQDGDPEAARRLGQAMGEILEDLSEEEREQLAQRLRGRLDDENRSGSPLSEEELERLAKQLESKAGKQALRDALKELAEPDPSEEAEREQGLNDADRGGADAERELGGLPIPLADRGPSGRSQGSQPGGDRQDGSPGTGSRRDQGRGNHEGKTDPVPTDPLRSKAQGKLDGSAPMHGSTLGRSPARAGETANQQGTGALGRAAPGELGGVDESDVPEEYREQVGRYFQP